MREDLGTGMNRSKGLLEKEDAGAHIRMWAPEEEKMAKSVSGVWTLLDKR